jgi:hypothetical protein
MAASWVNIYLIDYQQDITLIICSINGKLVTLSVKSK